MKPYASLPYRISILNTSYVIPVASAIELVRTKRAEERFSLDGEFLGIELGLFGFVSDGWDGISDEAKLPPAELPGIIFRPPISARGRKYLMALPKPWE